MFKATQFAQSKAPLAQHALRSITDKALVMSLYLDQRFPCANAALDASGQCCRIFGPTAERGDLLLALG